MLLRAPIKLKAGELNTPQLDFSTTIRSIQQQEFTH